MQAEGRRFKSVYLHFDPVWRKPNEFGEKAKTPVDARRELAKFLHSRDPETGCGEAARSGVPASQTSFQVFPKPRLTKRNGSLRFATHR